MNKVELYKKMTGKDEQALKFRTNSLSSDLEEEGFYLSEIRYAFLLFKNNEEHFKPKGTNLKREWENLPLEEKRNWVWVGINDQIRKGKWRGL